MRNARPDLSESRHFFRLDQRYLRFLECLIAGEGWSDLVFSEYILYGKKA